MTSLHLGLNDRGMTMPLSFSTRPLHRKSRSNQTHRPLRSSTGPFFLINLLLQLLLMAGCSSLNDKADDLMKQDAYEEAETIYKEVLRKDPHNTKALVGLKKARQGAISSELILVRRQRLGGNSAQAEENLRNILISLHDWKVYPTGAVAFTQNEEMDYAVQDIEERAQELLQRHFPIKLAYLLNRYRDFFQEKNLPVYKSLISAANKQGLDSCRAQMASTPANLSYYREFLAKECVYWGDTRPELKDPVQHGLFGHFIVGGEVSGIPQSLRPRLENQIQHFLQESPWYETTSNQSLAVTYSGTYQFNTERRATKFTHAYHEDEPYSSYEPVTKHRSHQVPVTKQERQPDGQLATVTTSEWQDEVYTEMETITRTRTVTKSFSYPGTEIEQNIALRTLISAAFDASTAPTGAPASLLRLTANSADRNLTSESQTQAPGVGLYARTAKVFDENQWFAQLLDGWSHQNLEQLRDIWVRRYCRDFQTNWTSAQRANAVFACMRERSRPAPAYVDAWLTQNLGLPSVELQSIFL